jgi:hypothetical protein
MSQQTAQSQLPLNLKRKTAEPPMMQGSKELREALADLLLAALNLQEAKLDGKEGNDDA